MNAAEGQRKMNQADIQPSNRQHAVAQVVTDRASIHLQQLCKHFAHKLTVAFTPSEGLIECGAGSCRLAADERLLTLRVEAADAAGLAQLEDVVARHLERFAFRAPLAIEWRAAATAAE